MDTIFYCPALCRYTDELKIVGFAVLNNFMDPKELAQPTSRSVRDYVLNQGAFEVPLHTGKLQS